MIAMQNPFDVGANSPSEPPKRPEDKTDRLLKLSIVALGILTVLIYIKAYF